jgi:hypothetical protein
VQLAKRRGPGGFLAETLVLRFQSLPQGVDCGACPATGGGGGNLVDDHPQPAVLAGVTLDILSYYFNIVADTDVDFPRAMSSKPQTIAVV